MIDNCYCEFVERTSPLEVGADIIVGSLIKNLGGSIASNGAYIVGKKDLVELCADICRRYNLTVNNIIRHYDVTGKDCPRYYVQNPNEWIKFKNDVANKLGRATTVSVAVEEVKGSEEPVKRYKNGSTKETIYADTSLTKVIGSLSPYEECDCFGIFNNRPMVRYKIDGTNNYKIGFAVWTGGVK